MKSLFKKIICIFTAFSIIICFGACSQKLSYKRSESDYFNTPTTILAYDNFDLVRNQRKFKETVEDIGNAFTEIENMLSVEIEQSDIFRFNLAAYGETVTISNLTAEIIKTAKELYDLTNGAYNPSVYNLVDLWGFSPRFLNFDDLLVGKDYVKMPYDRERNSNLGFPLPEDKYIEAFKKLTDFNKVILSGNENDGYKLTKNCEPVEVDGTVYQQKIDLGGIGKGYAADLGTLILKEKGYENGYISVGSSSISILKRGEADDTAPQKDQWKINLTHPRKNGENYLYLFDKDVGISTSGTYQTNYVTVGQEYNHIIDGYTGKPINNGVIASSVIGGKAGKNDALTTALVVMGKEKAIEFINANLKEYKVTVFYYNAFTDCYELITNIKPEEYVLLDKDIIEATELNNNGDIVYKTLL